MFHCCLLSANRRLPSNPEYTGSLHGLSREMVKNDGRLTSHVSGVKRILHQQRGRSPFAAPPCPFGFSRNRNRAAVPCTALILLQASSSALCGGKGAVSKHFTPQEDAR